MVRSTVPVAVLAVPVGGLAMRWVGGPWRLWASDTVLVISLNMGESLRTGEEGGEGEDSGYIALALGRPARSWSLWRQDAPWGQMLTVVLSTSCLSVKKALKNHNSYNMKSPLPNWRHFKIKRKGENSLFTAKLDISYTYLGVLLFIYVPNWNWGMRSWEHRYRHKTQCWPHLLAERGGMQRRL